MADRVDDSTLRRWVRFSDALRDATQNPQPFELSPGELEILVRLVERTDQRVAKSRKLQPAHPPAATGAVAAGVV